MAQFNLVSEFKLQGDQEQAVEKLTRGISKGKKHQVLLGVTGSGKTFTIANVIQRFKKPALVISHNKTLAAQLFSEFKQFFPHNRVEYFVSYYDYYQPEAYVPQTDAYIEKDASINDEIDRLRLSATSALLESDDVIIVASVSCIYGLGDPADWQSLGLHINCGREISQNELIRHLVDLQYERNDYEFSRGKFRLRGETIEIWPAYGQDGRRLEWQGEKIQRLSIFNPLTGEIKGSPDDLTIFPAKHFVIPRARLEKALGAIEEELDVRLGELKDRNKLLEAQRLEVRTNYDLEMFREIGYCPGIENYSRHLNGRSAGEPPSTLIDYFPQDYLLVIDESHVTIPQLRGMYAGDRSRKETLVKFGFRLPSALDNRPLNFSEFGKKINKVIYLSATPGDYEQRLSQAVVEQIIRPTGLLDPEIAVKPAKNQIDDLIEEIRQRVKKKERILVTTLTKRMAEDLSNYLCELGIKVRYLHSEVETIERMEILRSLRLAEFDCLVGINLLREGLDLPEVSLVAILDADKEGFLRSYRALIQVAGRAARNVRGKVIMYADKSTPSMTQAIEESNRRRQKQLAYNKKHGVTPKSISKEIQAGIESLTRAKEQAFSLVRESRGCYSSFKIYRTIEELKRQMDSAACNLEFEKAAVLRDEIREMEKIGKQKLAGRKRNSRDKKRGAG
ncbi:MAG: excinuclease ABC subunit UvrB [Candidatus Ratteibacteria bacterium]|nr:excinuclease ABC subunit UvrB [Candidatus Ratteibacteria bacterium]